MHTFWYMSQALIAFFGGTHAHVYQTQPLRHIAFLHSTLVVASTKLPIVYGGLRSV